MSAPTPSVGALSPGDALLVERACSSFEAAWRSGEAPRLEEHLGDAVGQARLVLLAELLMLELAYRQRGGDRPHPDEYLARFPDAEDLVRGVFERESPSTMPTRVLPSAAGSGGRAVGGRPTVSGYEVLGELGRGAMGVVYKARQVSLDRVVALKMIRVGPGDEHERRRIRTEAEVVARLHHPNIVQIHEVIEGDGAAFLALEYCPGGSLHERLRGTPLPPDEAGRLVETLARAMHAAHQAGVVHRDLKPANVLLSLSRDAERSAVGALRSASRLNDVAPKVSDFGLARRVGEASQTQSGAVVGTPSYMAPEQARGKGKEAGPPADVYALGAILYECLTGRPPFKAATMWETLEQVLTAEPVRARQLNPQVPRDLETICQKCLQKEPHRRYATAEELAEDLRRFRAGEPIRARPVGPVERLAKWARRRPATAALLAVILLLIAAGGVWLWGWRQQRSAADRAATLALGEAQVLHAQARANALDPTKYHEALMAAGKAAVAADGASDDLRWQIAELERQLQSEEAAVTNDRRLLTALLDVRGPRDLNSDRHFTLDDPINDENFALPFREYGVDVDSLPTAAAAPLLKQRPAAVVTEIVAALDEWAAERRRHSTPERWRRVADLAAALDDHADPVRQELRQIVARDHLAQDHALSVLAAALRPVAVPLVVPLGEDRLRLLELSRRTDPAAVPVLQVVALARALHAAGEDPEAEGLLRAAVRARPQEAVLYHTLGVLLSSGPAPRWQQAAECYTAARAVRPELGLALVYALTMSGRERESLPLLEQMMRTSPGNARLHLVRGYLLFEKGDLAGARAAYLRAAELDPHDATARFNLGYTLSAAGDLEGAAAAYRRACELAPENAEAFYNLGCVLQDANDADGAVTAYRKAIELDGHHVYAHVNLGKALLQKGDVDAAVKEYRKAIDLDPREADAHYNLGNALVRKNDPNGAAAAYHRAADLDPDDPDKFWGLGLALKMKGDPDAAAAALRRVLEIDPKFAEKLPEPQRAGWQKLWREVEEQIKQPR